MKTVVGIRFRKPGKTYFFDPGILELKNGDNVIVETSMGKELGTVMINQREIDETKLKEPLKRVIKVATIEDKKHQEENVIKEKEAFETCKKKIKEHKLAMNLVEARYLFDNSKLIFYFTADDRIDFRELVKDLASIYRTRIELRQISIRDQIKRIGGNGVCGRELCCCSFLNECDGVSIKMAKEQNLSLNASKITGNCGRLMCCLRYEQNVYEDKMKKLPHPGAIAKTEDGEGTVDSVEVLREIIKVKLKDNEGNNYFKKYNFRDIKIIKDYVYEEKKENGSQGYIYNNKNETDTTQEDIKELEKIEQMDKIDRNNSNDNEV